MPSYKTVLVTGGAGFIGSHVTDLLLRKRFKVVVVDDLSTGLRSNLNPNVTFYKLSVTSPALRSVFAKHKPDYVVHLAAQVSVRRSIAKPMEDAKTNICGTLNVLECCRAFHVKKIVAASSGGVMYPAKLSQARETDVIVPEAPYGVAKRALELYLEHYARVFHLPFVALRFSNVYGPRQRAIGEGEGGVVAVLCETLLSGKTPFLTWGGKQTRDFIYVGDAAQSVVQAITSSFAGIVNISSCEEVSIQRIFDVIARLAKFTGKPDRRPAVVGEKARTCLDNRLAWRVLKWRPTTSLEEGLRKSVEAARKERLAKRA